MKRVYVNEDWCLACHLCEYYCAAANSGAENMIKAFANGKKPIPRIKVEEGSGINFAVQCRHCETPLCVKSCITGALSQKDGVISCDESRCVGCYTCVLSLRLYRNKRGFKGHTEMRPLHEEQQRRACLCKGLSEQGYRP